MITFATPEYACTRDWTNWSEGSVEALQLMTDRLRAGEPQCHVRYADGEFWSILGRRGPNADGQEHMPETLGRELNRTLHQIAESGVIETRPNVLVGGYWDVPAGAKPWLVQNNLLELVPWCPVQVFVTCINGDAGRLPNGAPVPGTEKFIGPTMAFLEALRAHPGNKYLVANSDVGQLAGSFGARHVSVTLPRRKRDEIADGASIPVQVPGVYGAGNAYTDMRGVEAGLRKVLYPGSVVIWCAGLGCKPTLWRLFRDCPGTTHIDCGCFFDLAAGLCSRTWMSLPPDPRQRVYRDHYIPWLRGER